MVIFEGDEEGVEGEVMSFNKPATEAEVGCSNISNVFFQRRSDE